MDSQRCSKERSLQWPEGHYRLVSPSPYKCFNVLDQASKLQISIPPMCKWQKQACNKSILILDEKARYELSL